MIQPIRRTRVVPVLDPLPPAWLRLRETRLEGTAHVGSGIVRTGPDGTLQRALVASIDQAREVVLVASFLLADAEIAEALLRAAERRCRVYVLTASEERLQSSASREGAFDARMAQEHQELLDRLAGRVLVRTAAHFHAKFLVTDPQGEPSGWLSTANFNRALLDSVDLGVSLDREAARELARWFAWAFWNEAQHELVGTGRLAQAGPPPGQPVAPGGAWIRGTTKQHATLREEVVRQIRAARQELFVASYGLEAGHPVVEEIAARARDGVAVTVLTRPRGAVAGAVARLAEAGVRVLAHEKLHAKAIASEQGALVMTANLESAGMDTGFEVGIPLDVVGAGALRRAMVGWAEGFPWRYAPAAARAEHLGEICLAGRGMEEGRRVVVEEEVVRLGAVTAVDALKLEEAPEPDLRAPETKTYPRRLRFEWEVLPPRLPSGARERLQKVERPEAEGGRDMEPGRVRVSYEPPVFEKGGGTFVVVRQPDQRDAARCLAAELGGTVVVP